MILRDVHPGTMVQLASGQIVVAAVGPGRGRRRVMQAKGIMLDMHDNQTVKILDVAWSSDMGMLLIEKLVFADLDKTNT